MPSHRACSKMIWTSWIRMVRSCGTQRWTSCGVMSSPMTPPPLPVSAMTCISRSRAVSMARTTLGELPLVEIATSTSPGWPSAWTCRSKISSNP
ncbi:Uncharacterised protein [Bordetella pertussis]|nr:Uncharacterised protein [Bordetella pertussis]